MNPHLNLFRFYNESQENQFIENNLSRAIAICLKYDSLFFYEMVRKIVNREDFDYLFSTIGKDDKVEIDMQIDPNNIDRENYSKIYAVALTTERTLSMDDFFIQPEIEKQNNFTDIILMVKDIAIIFEVKRTGEDCKTQLFNQVLPFIKEKEKYQIIPKHITWKEILHVMENVMHTQLVTKSPSYLLNDFIHTCQFRFPSWFESKPFKYLKFSSKLGSSDHTLLMNRIKEALIGTGYELLPYNDRLGISLKIDWASELIPSFETSDTNKEAFVVFYIWPGNTKQQGYSVFNKSLDWTAKEALMIDGKDYPLYIYSHLKFCHFNRYVSNINFEPDELKKPLFTPENFYKHSGKIKEKDWDNFAKFLDEYFIESMDWREQCGWHENFLDSDRTYFTVSFGYEVAVNIPFKEFQELDKKEDDIQKVSKKILSVLAAFQNMII